MCGNYIYSKISVSESIFAMLTHSIILSSDGSLLYISGIKVLYSTHSLRIWLSENWLEHLQIILLIYFVFKEFNFILLATLLICLEVLTGMSLFLFTRLFLNCFSIRAYFSFLDNVISILIAFSFFAPHFAALSAISLYLKLQWDGIHRKEISVPFSIKLLIRCLIS